jgi:acetolactate synthase-1/2/3 large subunit
VEEVPGGVLAARALKAAGIDRIFALPGGHILPLFEGARREGIRIVDVRHEEAAVLSALGHALATGRPAVAAVTAGPGVTNSVPGVAEAQAYGAPVTLLAGRTATRKQNRGAVQDLDQVRLLRTLTKWQATCSTTSRIPEAVSEALYRARAGAPGPTFLDIPQDVMAGAARPPEGSSGYPDEPPRAGPAAADVERAVALLGEAERPVAVAGGGAHWSDAGDALEDFARRTGIPVTTTSAARGLLPDGHPQCLGGLIHGALALASSDVALVLGSAFNANLVYGGLPLFAPDGRVIQVDVRPEALAGNRRPDLAVASDVRAFLEAVTHAWPGDPRSMAGWLARAREGAEASRRSWESESEADARTERVHPGWLARAVAEFASGLGNHTMVCDGGDSLVWGLAFATATGPGRNPHTGSALGTLGVGLPFAVAAKAARPREPVFLFTGDGSFGLSAMELDTAARHGLPVIVVVVNNGGWGDVRHEQRALYGSEADTGAVLSDFRYDYLAEAVGGHGATVERPEDLEPELRRAVDADVVAVINVMCDPEAISSLMRNLAELDVM